MPWTYDFDIATPSGEDVNQRPKFAWEYMNEIKQAMQERIAKDHYFPLTGTEVSDTEAGEHKKITLRTQAAKPSAEADKGYIYTKDVTATVNGTDYTVAELHFEDEDGNEIQITSQGQLIIPTSAPSTLVNGKIWMTYNANKGARLCYRRGGTTYYIFLYIDVAFAGTKFIQLNYDRTGDGTGFVTLYAILTDTTDDSASHLRVRNAGTTYAIAAGPPAGYIGALTGTDGDPDDGGISVIGWGSGVYKMVDRRLYLDYTWDQAVAYAAAATLGTFSDWDLFSTTDIDHIGNTLGMSREFIVIHYQSAFWLGTEYDASNAYYGTYNFTTAVVSKTTPTRTAKLIRTATPDE